jgi:hypothetical protein
MNPTHPNSRKHFQQALDAEIKSLEESIQALKSRRNTLSPVSSLPPEIFAAIFSFLCLPGIPSLGGKPDRNIARLRISHVCQQWRKIALNHPLLWSHIDFNTLTSAGASEILIRAKSVPLYLEARLSFPFVRRNDGIFQKELQSRVPHIRHLSIEAHTADCIRRLRSTLEGLVSPAPTLEYLSVFSGDFSEDLFIPDNLFDGCTPRLSCLELRNCDISWKSPLLKGLQHLKIITPTERPKLAVWLDALSELRQLKALTLHSVSPVAPPSFDVERTSTLPSLSRLYITATPGDCALTLAHLDLPALTCLNLAVISHWELTNYIDAQKLLTYVVRHAHGPQDPRPLQSALIRSHETDHLEVAAWTVPNIDAEVHDPPALLGTTIPPRIALSFENGGRSNYGARSRILNMVMVALPLDDLVMLAAQDLHIDSDLALYLSTQEFWLRHAPQWPLLQRVRVAPPVVRGFIQMLLEDNEMPLLPSLTELVVCNDILLDGLSGLPLCNLCNALMKRVEQGVPLDMLDLRELFHASYGHAGGQVLSEIVVNVLGPDPSDSVESLEAIKRRSSMWDALARGPFIEW